MRYLVNINTEIVTANPSSNFIDIITECNAIYVYPLPLYFQAYDLELSEVVNSNSFWKFWPTIEQIRLQPEIIITDLVGQNEPGQSITGQSSIEGVYPVTNRSTSNFCLEAGTPEGMLTNGLKLKLVYRDNVPSDLQSAVVIIRKYVRQV